MNPSLKIEILKRYHNDPLFHAQACTAAAVLVNAMDARGVSLLMEEATEIACAQLWQAEQVERYRDEALIEEGHAAHDETRYPQWKVDLFREGLAESFERQRTEPLKWGA